MSFLNVEIKAHCGDAEQIEYILMQNDADYRGIDHQVDTYFKVAKGRLKLREGNIENNLIYYERKNQAGPKESVVSLAAVDETDQLKEVLSKSNGILCIVDKHRKIFFIDNVKFHLDEVKELGSFVEIEAIDKKGDLNRVQLQNQCERFIQLFKIRSEDLVSVSYCDLLTMTKQK